MPCPLEYIDVSQTLFELVLVLATTKRENINEKIYI
jgi:hypothetical protein